MKVEDQYINDLKYNIVYCNVLLNRIEFFVKEFNDFQSEIPSNINGKSVAIIKVC